MSDVNPSNGLAVIKRLWQSTPMRYTGIAVIAGALSASCLWVNAAWFYDVTDRAGTTKGVLMFVTVAFALFAVECLLIAFVSGLYTVIVRLTARRHARAAKKPTRK